MTVGQGLLVAALWGLADLAGVPFPVRPVAVDPAGVRLRIRTRLIG